MCSRLYNIACLFGEKGTDLTQKRKTVHSQSRTMALQNVRFLNTTMTDQLLTVSWSNNRHPTDVDNVMFKGQTFPLPASVVQSKGQIFKKKIINKPPHRDQPRTNGNPKQIFITEMLIGISVITKILSDILKGILRSLPVPHSLAKPVQMKSSMPIIQRNIRIVIDMILKKDVGGLHQYEACNSFIVNGIIWCLLKRYSNRYISRHSNGNPLSSSPPCRHLSVFIQSGVYKSLLSVGKYVVIFLQFRIHLCR